MPKVYVFDSEIPAYIVKTEKPTGYKTDEVELTDEELSSILAAEEAMLDAQELLRARLFTIYTEARFSELKPIIQTALKRVASQVGIPYLGFSTGGAVDLLHEYCTFTVPGVEPVVLGVTIRAVDGLFNLSVDITGKDSGTIHWRLLSRVKIPGAALRQKVEEELLKLPEPSAIQGILTQKEPNAPAT